MSPRPDVSGERKTQILNAAENVFNKKGFDAARMDDIADETGLSKGTLYLYFKGKDDVIFGILDRLFKREFSQLTSLKAERVSAYDQIMNMTDLVIKDAISLIHLNPLVYNFLAIAFRNKLVQKALKVYINEYMDIFTPVIQRGIDSGEFRALDAHEIAVAGGAIIEGTILLWVYDNSLVDPEKHIRTGMQLLLEGVLNRLPKGKDK
jgi:AcrR family transcriptional regulator